MNQDFSELVGYLDGKFVKVDEKFTKVDEGFVSIEKRLGNMDLKLIGMGAKLSELDEKKADKEDINKLLTAIDSYAKKADAYFQEMLMLSQKVDRHEKWFHQIAEKLGIKLEY